MTAASQQTGYRALHSLCWRDTHLPLLSLGQRILTAGPALSDIFLTCENPSTVRRLTVGVLIGIRLVLIGWIIWFSPLSGTRGKRIWLRESSTMESCSFLQSRQYSKYVFEKSVVGAPRAGRWEGFALTSRMVSLSLQGTSCPASELSAWPAWLLARHRKGRLLTVYGIPNSGTSPSRSMAFGGAWNLTGSDPRRRLLQRGDLFPRISKILAKVSGDVLALLLRRG